MVKKDEIIVKDVAIKTMSKDGIDYICITDIAKQKNWMDPNGVIANWMRNRNTIEFLGIWETLYNPGFTPPPRIRRGCQNYNKRLAEVGRIGYICTNELKVWERNRN